MCSILLPKGVIDYIDSKCRAFLSMVDKSCTGGHCKAPWDLVCIPKEKGGLGIKDLHTQNRCLLQKFLVKLHTPSSSPWHSWFTTNYGWSSSRDLGDTKRSDTPVWSALVSGLQGFRDTTSITVGCGTSTSFWLDLWLDDTTLVDCFPALFSHSRRKNASVARVAARTLRLPESSL